jgi:inhibitor of KinA
MVRFGGLADHRIFMRIIPASDSSLLVEFGSVVTRDLHRQVLSLFRGLLKERDPRIRNFHPGYTSLLIDFNPLALTHSELSERVYKLIEVPPNAEDNPARTITIPVCYDAEFGPDLADVAIHHGISVDEVVHLHTSATYLVYFIGFSPGFAYLGELTDKLETPRLATPRVRVPAGSVGIAGKQTGVYPQASPGGWRVIGRTPVRMFDTLANPPSRLQAGDSVQFVAIQRSSFDKLASS